MHHCGRCAYRVNEFGPQSALFRLHAKVKHGLQLVEILRERGPARQAGLREAFQFKNAGWACLSRSRLRA